MLCFFVFFNANVSHGGRVWKKLLPDFEAIPAHFHLLEPQPKQTTQICIGFGSLSLVSARQRRCRALEMRERECTRCEKPNSTRE